MRAAQLNEDYHDDWLAKYTLENLDKWPSNETVNALSKRYPVDEEIIIYRGMNFSSKEEWNEFVKNIKAGENEIAFGGISSWTPSEGTAKQFAITRPTYFLNAELMKAEDKRRKEREHISGYRGIIIKTKVQQGMLAIDVRKSKASKEDEIILGPGTYPIKVHKVIKKYADEMADSPELDQKLHEILDKVLAIKNEKKTDEYLKGFYDYIQHHYQDRLSTPEFKDKIYQIAIGNLFDKSKKISDLISVSVWEKAFGQEETEVTIQCNPSIFMLYEQGLLPDNKTKYLTKYADAIFSAYQKAAKKYQSSERIILFDLGSLDKISKYTSNPSKVTTFIQSMVGAPYQRINSKAEIDRINNIKDPNQKRDAIRKQADDIKKILQQLGR